MLQGFLPDMSPEETPSLPYSVHRAKGPADVLVPREDPGLELQGRL